MSCVHGADLTGAWYGAEHLCDTNLGEKAREVRARAEARVARIQAPSTKAPMLRAKKRKSRKARRGDK